MSKFVNQIIKKIADCPDEWVNYKGSSIANLEQKILITGYGNGWFFSTIEVAVNGHWVPSSWNDKRRLEISVKKWYRQAPLHVLQY